MTGLPEGGYSVELLEESKSDAGALWLWCSEDDSIFVLEPGDSRIGRLSRWCSNKGNVLILET